MSAIDLAVPTAAKSAAVARPRPDGQRVARSPLRAPASGAIGLAVLVFLAVLAIAGPVVWPVHAETQDLANRLAAPWGFGGTMAHPLGTDGLGRDTLARVIAGARVSLPVSVVATAVSGGVGVTLGVLAGYRGGWIDRAVSWLSDVQLAIPFVVFAIVVTATFGNSLGNVLATLVVTGWVAYARVIRLQTWALRGSAWMEAARALGAGPARLLGRHLLPNLTATAVILATQQAGAMILYESSLSFLGLGLGGSTVTWGGMAAQGRDAVFTAPWVAAIPGVVIALAILGFNLTGDWLATRGRRQGWL